MRHFAVPHAIGTFALLLSLGGCGGGGTQGNASALASLDTRLTNSAAPANGAAPAKAGPSAKTPMVKAPAVQAPATQANGDAVLAAHQAIIADSESEQVLRSHAKGAVRSLAAANGRAVGGCAGRDLRYGEQWASAMPEGLGLYPGAHLVEAAGTDTGRCALRVISFTTADSPQAVAAHYTSIVRQAGFDAERQPCRTEIRLGGTRKGDDAAYMLFARRTAHGLTEVDIIASAGPTA